MSIIWVPMTEEQLRVARMVTLYWCRTHGTVPEAQPYRRTALDLFLLFCEAVQPRLREWTLLGRCQAMLRHLARGRASVEDCRRAEQLAAAVGRRMEREESAYELFWDGGE